MKPVGIRTGRLVLLGLTLLLTACGGGEEPSLVEEALLLQPAVQKLSIAPGGTATLRVNVERLGRLTGAVVVSAEGGPAGMALTESIILSANETDGTLQLKATSRAEVGTKGRMLLSAWSGNELYHSSVDVEVVAPFSTSSVESVFIPQSQAVSVQVNLKRTAGFKEPVRLGPSPELPAGMQVSPPVPVTLVGDATAVSFELRPSFDTPPGPQRITFVATWGDITTTTLLTVNVGAGPSFWDDSFGNFGMLQLPEPRNFSSAVAQPDGRIVMATGLGTSSIWVYRLQANGTVDTTFGNQGVTEFLMTEYHSDPKVLLQPDGKVLMVTIYQGTVWLHRLNTDGSLDTAFGTQGRVTAAMSSYAFTADLGLQEDGRILVATVTGAAVECIRFTATGQVDETYGSLGRATLNAQPSNGYLANSDIRLRVDALGATVVSGTYGGSDVGRVFLGRLTSQGQKQTTFGINGVATLSVAPHFYLQGIDRAPNGWVVIGHVAVDNKAPGEHRILRIAEDGNAYGLQWSATLPSTEPWSEVTALSDGRVLALVNSQLKRWSAGGQLDANFQVNYAYGSRLFPLPGDGVLVGAYQTVRKLKPPAP